MSVTRSRCLGAVMVAAVVTAGITALAPAAMAHPQGGHGATAIDTTIDANSQLRRGPHLWDESAGVTRTRADFVIECYTRGSWYNDGKHHTDVWYKGAVIDSGRIYTNVYSWGGNVNTRHDPPSGLRFCD